MSHDVQVRVECAQCGAPLTNIAARYGDSVRMPTERERCPVCAEPTYGPLTVEMVAEALHAAWCARYNFVVTWDDAGDSTRACWAQVARFVIRLLDKSEPSAMAGMIGARLWLLDLARRP